MSGMTVVPSAKNSQCDEHGLPAIEPGRLYTTSESAQLIGKSDATLRRWRNQGGGPRYQQSEEGGYVRYLGLWLIQYRRDSIVDPE